MAVRQFFPSAGFQSGPLILVLREQVFTSGLFGSGRLKPDTVDKIKIRTKWRKAARPTADEDGEEVIGSKFSYPIGKAGKSTVKHEDERTQDLRLVYGRPSSI